MAQNIGPDPFTCGPWKIESSTGSILGQDGLAKFEEELEMKSLPDMIFNQNKISLKYNDNFEIKFNVRDALQSCDKTKCPNIQVAAAQSWI